MDRFIARESTGTALSGPVRRGALGRELVHTKDTPQHSLACVCLSCNGFVPQGEVLPPRPDVPEEAFVFVLGRKVPGRDGKQSSNTKWICMGCGEEFTSSVTRMREHRLRTQSGSIKVCP